MAREALHLLHRRILPDVDSMLAIAVRAHKFGGKMREQEVTDLAAGIMGADKVRIRLCRAQGTV